MLVIGTAVVHVIADPEVILPQFQNVVVGEQHEQ
jgi:hypothetical protein